MIVIKVEPWKVVKAVYDMCRPVGMGFLQVTPEDMTEEQAKEVIELSTKYRPNEVYMDYVGGRQCKFNFQITPEGCEFDDTEWYDHHPAELTQLIAHLKELEAS